jgi:hypothetical protein
MSCGESDRQNIKILGTDNGDNYTNNVFHSNLKPTASYARLQSHIFVKRTELPNELQVKLLKNLGA